MVPDPQPGECVIIAHPDPENPYLEGVTAHVKAVTPYGALLKTEVGTGEYRAHWHEMVRVATTNGKHHAEPPPPPPVGYKPTTPKVQYDQAALVAAAKASGYSEDPCSRCGSLTLKRTGVCCTCDTCGENNGCS